MSEFTSYIEAFPDGTVVEKFYTDEELVRLQEDADEREAYIAAEQDRLQSDSRAAADAIAHAKSLGFSDEMIRVMYPNLGGS